MKGVMPDDKAPEPQWVVADPQDQDTSTTVVPAKTKDYGVVSFTGGSPIWTTTNESHWECEGANWVVKFRTDNPTVPYCAWISDDKQGSESRGSMTPASGEPRGSRLEIAWEALDRVNQK